MKKISFVMAAMGLLAMTSCSKKEVTPASSTQTKSTVNAASSLARTGSGRWLSNFSGGECMALPANCYELPIIVVTPTVIDAIKTASTSGNSGTVGGTFTSTDLTDICDNMEATEVAKLQSGNYYITLNYESSTVINFMAGTSYPVTTQNMDFAFQIIK